MDRSMKRVAWPRETLPPAIEGPRPFPYPNGWFALCYSHELKRGRVRIAPFMGSDLVLYRGASGIAHAVSPYCPHLGAHLGHGGKVDGEDLVCPFHGLAYGPDGACVRTPFGPPPRAALDTWPVQERNGAIFVWRDHLGRMPDRDVPEIDATGFSKQRRHCSELGGYAHDVAENLSDFAHFDYLHGFSDAEMTHGIEDNLLVSHLTGQWFGTPIRIRFVSHGLGFSVGECHIPRLGVKMIQRAYATPTAPLKWTLRWTDAVQVSLFNMLPAGLRRLMNELTISILHRIFAGIVAQDHEIWANRRFDPHPRLLAREATISTCRRWMMQFYPDQPVR